MPQGIDLLPVVIPGEIVRENREWQRESSPPDRARPYIVIVYNDDWHSFEQVEMQLQKATGCSLEKAEALAMEIHQEGRAIVFHGDDRECEQVAAILRRIKLQVETDRA